MKSPCIDECGFDRRTGWCKGCGRTVQEVRGWRKAQPHQLRKISAELPRRLAKLERT
ncbi:DUF1289 domain-containing protein [Novosphingobium lindaniclasticum]|uniref:Fe-S protein n=1 Tax=Novosphingobium lindaniclasticum LE124 TaxID=1096930 RepID=T0IVM4_9SPHN|nr:DUF1289 domain-containing protein [Novosphingobium lindaniclasticum]EQB15870.1 hypothetical protein L284_10695 [Novosphingobium lindaniclasticum LE124]